VSKELLYKQNNFG